MELPRTSCPRPTEAEVSNGPGNKGGYRETEIPLPVTLDCRPMIAGISDCGEIAGSRDDRTPTSIAIASIMLNSFRLTPVGMHAGISLFECWNHLAISFLRILA